MTTPRKRTVLLSSVVLAILIIGAIHFVRPARDIAVEIGGSPDQTLTATFSVDGTTKKEILKTPFKRSFSASRFSYSIARDRELDKPDLSVQIFVDDVPHGNWSTDSPGQGVEGMIRTPSLFHLIGGEYGMGYVE
jgi:hypothetical protein